MSDGEQPSEAEIYTGLRRQVLELQPGQVDGLEGAPLLALLMEAGYPEAVATLVAVADGTTSMYFSNGGGVIGAGAHEAVAAASRRWLAAGLEHVTSLEPVEDPRPPAEGAIQFVAVTGAGLLGAVAGEDEVTKPGHALWPLFVAANDVITQIRLVQGG